MVHLRLDIRHNIYSHYTSDGYVYTYARCMYATAAHALIKQAIDKLNGTSFQFFSQEGTQNVEDGNGDKMMHACNNLLGFLFTFFLFCEDDGFYFFFGMSEDLFCRVCRLAGM